MGNSQSPSKDPRFVSASRAFAPAELDELKSLFVSLSAQSQSSAQYISPSVFQAYFAISGPLGARMFDLVTQKRNDEKLTFEDLVMAKTFELDGDNGNLIFHYQFIRTSAGMAVLSTKNQNNFLKPFKTISLEIHWYSKGIRELVRGSNCAAKVEREEFPVEALGAPDLKELADSAMRKPSRPNLRGLLILGWDMEWKREEMRAVLHFRHSHRQAVNGEQLVVLTSILEALFSTENADPRLSLPRDTIEIFLNAATFSEKPSSICKEVPWKFVDATKSRKQDGPTVLLIKDKEGYIYGGYASQPWKRHGDFYGDLKSFLFQLHPRASINRPTGANNNLQWKLGTQPSLNVKIEAPSQCGRHNVTTSSISSVSVPLPLAATALTSDMTLIAQHLQATPQLHPSSTLRALDILEMAIFDPASNPTRHVVNYNIHMDLFTVSEGLKCKAFSVTLDEQGKILFASLAPGSITSFRQLTDLFEARFSNIGKDLSLRDYIVRFNQETQKVLRLLTEVYMSTLI
ncbi:hypothetical protein ACLOJK_005944 [Asimina triloba]